MAENSNSLSAKILWAWFVLLLLLAFCMKKSRPIYIPGAGEDEEVSWYGLTPCSGRDSVFATMPYEQWATYYHNTVNDVVNAQIAQSTLDDNAIALRCTAANPDAPMPGTDVLIALARTLPLWKSRFAIPPFLMSVGAPPVLSSDFTAVLQELLRIYECSLHERQLEGYKTDASETAPLNYPNYAEQLGITEELASARPALERTLILVRNIGQLRPLSTQLACMAPPLIDLRNVTGLLAEQASCWNRTWDAQGTLRDLPDNPDVQQEMRSEDTPDDSEGSQMSTASTNSASSTSP